MRYLNALEADHVVMECSNCPRAKKLLGRGSCRRR
jgi:hypothetical protein